MIRQAVCPRDGQQAGQQPRFQGFPKKTLLEACGIPIAKIARLALREGQCTNPTYRVHRWFARRLGSQFRAILTGLSLEPQDAGKFWDVFLGQIPLGGVVVLDPFVGGGTSLVEARRSGARVIGYDIDPVATFITRFELETAGYDLDAAAITKLCASVSKQVLPLHRTTVPGVGERMVLHHFWVEHRTCDSCGTSFEVHPHYQLAYDKERKRQWAFCKSCHTISEIRIGRKELRCSCGVHTTIAQGPLTRKGIKCPECGTVKALSRGQKDTGRPEWRLFAQEYLDETSTGVARRFKTASRGDQIRYAHAARKLKKVEEAKGQFGPSRLIPTNGRSDQRPIIHGFTRYRDLFNDRQLLHLTILGRAIVDLKASEAQRVLAMAFSEHLTTNCMYAGYAFGYRRISPMFSIHGYRHITRPVELNPWLDGIGRGTFPNALGKIRKAVEYAKAPTELNPRGGKRPSSTGGFSASQVSDTPRSVLKGSCDASISTESSEDLKAIPDGSVQLILTDPPYFDNLSYSELSDFYLAWHQSIGIAESPYDNPDRCAPIKDNLALTTHTDKSVADYRDRLQRILCECRRVLDRNGVMVFTFHHKSASAWNALAEALVRSGLECTAVLPMRGEGQGGLHSFTGTIKWDAVFVCRKGTAASKKSSDTVVVSKAAATQAKRTAEEMATKLAKNRKIGFRKPDRLNLERAMIVAAAELGTAKQPLIALSELVRSDAGGC